MKLVMPIPSAKLSPNARIHWASKARIAKGCRLSAKLRAYEAFRGLDDKRVASYRLCFYWPNKRRRDKDNATARTKNILDGLSDAIGQDDSEWDFDGVRFEIDKENPRLEIELVLMSEK